MTVTDEINEFITQNGGNARDALNIALAKLKWAERRIELLEQDIDEYERQEVVEIHDAEWGFAEVNGL